MKGNTRKIMHNIKSLILINIYMNSENNFVNYF